MSEPRKQALVLSGGGAYGAFEVGVVKALMTGKSPATGYEPLVPDLITGTSVGGYNATFLTARLGDGPEQAAAALEETWLDRVASGIGQCTNGVFRQRLSPEELLRPACYVPDPLSPFVTQAQDAAYFASQFLVRTAAAIFQGEGTPVERAIDQIYIGALIDTEPFRELIQDTIDFADVGSSATDLAIFATDWINGTLQTFTNRGNFEPIDALAVQASASIPILFPPTKIGSQLFADGGLLLNTPLKPAIDADAEVIHVVFLDPLVRSIPLPRPLSTEAEAFRITAILFASQVRKQVFELDALNRMLEQALGTVGPLLLSEKGEAVLRVVHRLIAGQLPDLKPIEVHTYRPSADILKSFLGFLDFDRGYIEELIEAGYQDAVRHSRPNTSREVPLEDSF